MARSINTKAYIERFLKIKDKEANIRDLVLNKPQMKLYDAIKKSYNEGKPGRFIVLKARQMGFSTLTEAILFTRIATASNIKSGIVTHEEQATTNLFNMTKLYYEKLPDKLKPEQVKNNAKGLVFNNKQGTGLNSVIKCMTAGNGRIGRSDTFQMLHISEYAFWSGDKKTTLAGLMQGVPNTLDSLVIIESTANGYDDFKELWDRAVNGENDFVPVFCAWWELDEYRMSAEGIELTQEEEKLKQLYNLDNEQIAWRRWCIKNNCQNDLNMFKQEYPACPEEAFLSSGESIFNKERIVEQLQKIRNLQPAKKGYFKYRKELKEYKSEDGLLVDVQEKITDIEFVEDELGYITIHEMPLVKTNKDGGVIAKAPYVLGGDTAGLGTDYFTAKVICNLNHMTVATLHKQKIDEDLYAEQIYCLGMFYHEAFVGLETNFSRHPTRVLEKYHYPNMYMRERIDSNDGTTDKVLGFETTSKTKPIIISGLVELMRESPDIEVDEKTLQEMLTFVQKPNGRKEAMDGFHDDLVMGLAITHFIAQWQTYSWIETEENQSNFISDNFNFTPNDDEEVVIEW